MQETLVQFLGQEDLLEKGQATHSSILGLPFGSAGKESACNVGDLGSILRLGKSPGQRERLPTPVFWPGKFHGLYSPWNSPGQDTGVGSLSFLQGTFPTQGSKPGLPHCRQILYQLSQREAQEYWSG